MLEMVIYASKAIHSGNGEEFLSQPENKEDKILCTV